jgi:hypothetical protein
MNNQMYLLKEMYDSIACVKTYELLESFFINENTIFVGSRRIGKTTAAFFYAMSSAINKENVHMGIYVDKGQESIYLDMLNRQCNCFCLDYTVDSINKRILFSNGSDIRIISERNYRGFRFSCLIIDTFTFQDDKFAYFLNMCNNNLKIITNSQTSFVRQYEEAYPDKVTIIKW